MIIQYKIKMHRSDVVTADQPTSNGVDKITEEFNNEHSEKMFSTQEKAQRYIDDKFHDKSNSATGVYYFVQIIKETYTNQSEEKDNEEI